MNFATVYFRPLPENFEITLIGLTFTKDKRSSFANFDPICESLSSKNFSKQLFAKDYPRKIFKCCEWFNL